MKFYKINDAFMNTLLDKPKYISPESVCISLSVSYFLCASNTGFGNEDFFEEDFENVFGKLSI